MDEEQRRRRAMELLHQGRRPSEVIHELNRSREWLAKWRRRFQEHGAAGLREISRAHHTHPATTSRRIVRAVLAARDRLGRRRGCGPRARPPSRNVSTARSGISSIVGQPPSDCQC